MRHLIVAAVLLTLAVGPARAAPQLFSLDAGKGGCTAKVRDLGAPGERALFTTKACPAQVILDVAGKRAVALEGATVKSFALGDGKATELAKLPASDAALWIEESGKLRAAWLVTEGVEAKTVQDAEGERTVVTFEGKQHAVADDDAASFPPWGTPAMAVTAPRGSGSRSSPPRPRPATRRASAPSTRRARRRRGSCPSAIWSAR